MPGTEVLLDVDTGVDDALAIMFAVRHPDLNVRGISCVTGNTDLDQVVSNTLTVLDHTAAGDIPVARGSDRPLVEGPRHAHSVHGDDGLGDLGLPASSRQTSPVAAVEMLRDAIRSSPEPVTLVALAPLTNVALLLRAYPEVAGGLERIVMMGGSASFGNASPVAEFNVWHDPEAAAIVLGSGVPVLMYGLDVFYRVTLGPDTYERLQRAADPGSRLAGRLLGHAHDVERDDPRVVGGGTIGDAGAVCSVVDGGALRVERLPVQVELAPGPSRGQTVVDRRVTGAGASRSEGPPVGLVDVALGVDADVYRDLFVSTLLEASRT